MHLSELIQSLGVRRDSWSADYDSPLQLEDFEPSRDRVDPGIERPANAWAPVAATMSLQQALLSASPIVVVDGIRRLHQRLFFQPEGPEGVLRYGGMGSLAVGALQIRPGTPQTLSQARLAQRRERYAFFCDYEAQLVGEAELPGVPGAFRLCSVASDGSPQGPLKAIHDAMRQAEDELVNELMATQTAGTLLVDGPLQRRKLASTQAVIGFVKTLQTQYLPPELQRCLYKLRRSERTPLFAIGSERLSWYLRLTEPGSLDHGLSGLVRLEVAAPKAHVQRVIALADRLAPVLPELVAPRYKDPRAPQNLVPIAALEQDLRRCLGDEVLVRRRIECFLHQSLTPRPEAMTPYSATG